MFTRGCLRRNMDIRIHLITMLWIGWIAYTNNSGLPLELTQFQSGDDVTFVCSTNTTINIEFTFWYMGDVRVLMSVSAGNVCHKHPPNSTDDTYAYSYDLYTSMDVSVSCGDHQHNMTLATTQYRYAGIVWRCEDQRKRVSNNLTLGMINLFHFVPSYPFIYTHATSGTGDTYAYSYDLYTSTDFVSVSCGDTQHIMTPTTTQYLHDDTVWRCEDQQYRVSNNLTLGFAGTTNNLSSQLTDSATTLAKLTTIKITYPLSNDYQDDTMYIAPGAGGGIMILIIIVICVCVVRRRTRKVTQAISDADNGAELSENPTYVRNQDEAADNKELLTNKTTVQQPAVVGAVNVDDLYAVPDKTPKHLSAVRGAVNVDDLYAIPDKTPEHQSAVRGAVNDSDMYAVPDKTPKHQPAEGGAVNVDDLYAVPDMSMKTKNGTYNSRSEADSEI